jgi:hypothetical protein
VVVHELSLARVAAEGVPGVDVAAHRTGFCVASEIARPGASHGYIWDFSILSRYLPLFVSGVLVTLASLWARS